MTILDIAPERASARTPGRLSHEERSELTHELLVAAHAADDPDERDRLFGEVVVINHRVALAVARRYQRKGVPLEDLEQVAGEGLTKAVQRFDPSLGHDLLSYAVPTIRGEIQRYFRDQSWMVRPQRRLQELQRQLNQVAEELAAELGREATHAEIRERLGIDDDLYQQTLVSFGCFQLSSLDQPLRSEGGVTIGESIADLSSDQEAAEARAVLAPALKRLGDRDRRILSLRFLEDRSQEQIGAELGVSQVQVSRLLNRILTELRQDLMPADAA